MSAPEPRHEKETAPRTRAVNPPEVVLVTTGSKEVGDVSEQYQTREDLEKALDESKKSEAQLRKIIDTIPTMAWCKLPDGSNEFSNQRWQDYTGIPSEEARGWGWQAAVHPEDLPKLMETWRKLLASGEPGELEARLQRHDGVFRWFLFRVEPLRDETGAVVKWYGTAIDIEDRKQTESLRAAEKRTLELIADGASLKDILNHLCSSIDVQVSPSVTTVQLMDPDGKRLWQTAGPLVPREWVSVISPGPVALEAGLCGTAAFLKARVIVTDVATDPGWPDQYRDLAIRNGIRAAWSQPILTKDNQVLGTFALYSSESRVPTDADLALIEGAGRIALIAIEGQRSRAERKQARIALEKAFEEIKILKDQLYKENLALRDEVDRASMFEEIVGNSSALKALLSRIAKVAPTDSTVLITGETGTGKELIARAVHKRSKRSGRAFVSVNCAALAPSLISSELFGHEKGAFTGATQRRLGRFELADGGTIFLDEVGELPADTQVALLRVLQEREFERVGGANPVHVDVRLITATNRDLEAATASGTFRSDLYYRLNVFPIEVPPLRERRDDVLMLLEYFVKRYANKAGKNFRKIDKRTLELFQSYDWPGNIRELQNVIERSVVLSSGDVFSVDEAWLSKQPLRARSRLQASQSTSSESHREQEIIEAALRESRGRVSGPSGAAATLRIPASTLESKIKALKIRKDQFKLI
jgi:PAS domain S-box-containing protein